MPISSRAQQSATELLGICDERVKYIFFTNVVKEGRPRAQKYQLPSNNQTGLTSKFSNLRQVAIKKFLSLGRP